MTNDEAESLRDAARAGDDVAAALPALVATCDQETTQATLREMAALAILWYFVHRRAWRELGEIIAPRRSRSSFYYGLATIARAGGEIAPAFEHILRPTTDPDEVQGLIAAVSACARNQPAGVARILADAAPDLFLSYLDAHLLPASGLDVTPAFPYVIASLESTDIARLRRAAMVCLLAAENRQHLGPTIDSLTRLLEIADDEARGHAAYALSFHWQTHGEGARVDELSRHHDALVRRRVARASYVILHSETGTEGFSLDVVDRIIRATRDPDDELREAALSCLLKAWQRGMAIPLEATTLRTIESDLCRVCSALPRRASWDHSALEPKAFAKLEKTGALLTCPLCHAFYTHSSDGQHVDGAYEETHTLERLAPSEARRRELISPQRYDELISDARRRLSSPIPLSREEAAWELGELETKHLPPR